MLVAGWQGEEGEEEGNEPDDFAAAKRADVKVVEDRSRHCEVSNCWCG